MSDENMESDPAGTGRPPQNLLCCTLLSKSTVGALCKQKSTEIDVETAGIGLEFLSWLVDLYPPSLGVLRTFYERGASDQGYLARLCIQPYN